MISMRRWEWLIDGASSLVQDVLRYCYCTYWQAERSLVVGFPCLLARTSKNKLMKTKIDLPSLPLRAPVSPPLS